MKKFIYATRFEIGSLSATSRAEAWGKLETKFGSNILELRECLIK